MWFILIMLKSCDSPTLEIFYNSVGRWIVGTQRKPYSRLFCCYLFVVFLFPRDLTLPSPTFTSPFPRFASAALIPIHHPHPTDCGKQPPPCCLPISPPPPCYQTQLVVVHSTRMKMGMVAVTIVVFMTRFGTRCQSSHFFNVIHCCHQNTYKTIEKINTSYIK